MAKKSPIVAIIEAWGKQSIATQLTFSLLIGLLVLFAVVIAYIIKSISTIISLVAVLVAFYFWRKDVREKHSDLSSQTEEQKRKHKRWENKS